jgi:endonuclease-3 related protein
VADFAPTRRQLTGLFDDLLTAYGEQAWWPADDAFEIAVGAVLTQNTNWSNVEKALANLAQAGVLSLAGLRALPRDHLAALIRPSGYYNIKARRLHNLCDRLASIGGLERLVDMPAGQARAELLSVNGVGAETADDILLYALGRPVFVIDTYTRRLLMRYALANGDEPYDVLRLGFQRALPPDVGLFRQYHALIVTHAKQACRKNPLCNGCGLQRRCPQQLA